MRTVEIEGEIVNDFFPYWSLLTTIVYLSEREHLVSESVMGKGVVFIGYIYNILWYWKDPNCEEMF